MRRFLPIFAKGKSNEKTISVFAIGASSTAVTCNNVTALAVGQHVFVGKVTSYAEAEYLGKISSIVGSVVTCQFVAVGTKVNGDALWTPTSSWQATTVLGVAGWEPKIDPHADDLDTTGACPVRTQTGDASEIIPFQFSTAGNADWRTLRAWLLSATSNGLTNFTAAFNDYDTAVKRCCEVKRSKGRELISAKSVTFNLRTFECEVCVVGEASYY